MGYITILLVFLCGAGGMYVAMRLRRPKYDGRMIVTMSDEGKLIYILELDGDPADLQDQKVVKFKVTDREDEAA